MLMRSRHAVRGFSMIEMAMAVVIVGVLLAIGIPSFRIWIENNHTRTATESLVSGLNIARANAVSQNTTVAFTLTAPPLSSWEVALATCAPPCPTAIEKRNYSEGSGPNVTVTSPSGTVVQFNNLGRMILPVPVAPANSIAIAVSNNKLTGADNRNLKVTVSVGGNVRSCDPSVTANTDPRFCY